MRAVKGHGTGNDFVVLPDPEGSLGLTPALVRALCDRRTGIGADGVLRVVRTSAAGEPVGDGAEWFMDYRNADGSIAEMCGNGVRVYARFLVDEGLAQDGSIALATRDGVKQVEVHAGGDVTVGMGAARVELDAARVCAAGQVWPAAAVDLGNPHAVALLPSLDAAGDLTAAPEVDPPDRFPDGVNVEFAVLGSPGRVSMRVHERGVGETQSCGTGACAVVAALRAADPEAPDSWQVQVPGGELTVTERADGQLLLRGPAVLVAEVQLTADWLAAARS